MNILWTSNTFIWSFNSKKLNIFYKIESELLKEKYWLLWEKIAEVGIGFFEEEWWVTVISAKGHVRQSNVWHVCDRQRNYTKQREERSGTFKEKEV